MRNLHDLQPSRRPLLDADWVRITTDLRPANWQQWVQGVFTNDPLDPLGRNTNYTTDYARATLRRLEDQYTMLRQARIENVALMVTNREWDALRWAMSPYEFRQRFGDEGAYANFMGVPLFITGQRLR